MSNDIIKIKKSLYSFFMGKYYPIAVAAVVTLGHITELEFYFNIVNILLAVTALCICDSIRPLYIVVITFTYQITKAHSPAIPTFSDYYFTGWRLPVMIILGTMAVGAIVCFVIKNRLVFKLDIGKTRLLLPLLILSAAFLLNGAFSQSHSAKGLIFGATQVVVYLAVFLLFYIGLSEKEDPQDTVDYLVYIALVVSWMLIIQMVHLFIFGDIISVGGINSDNINLGWVTKNPLGAILVSLIPILFYGAIKKARGYAYLVSATLVYICAVLTCSRNALLFGSLIFAACLIVCCFKGGERRKRFVGLIIFGVCALALMALLMREQIAAVAESVFKMGFDNNGRFKIWAQAWSLFCSNPLFGSGFFSIVDPDVYVAVEAMPTMAHNTLFELLVGTGVFGLLAYGYYRFEILKMAFVRPSLQKSFLTLAVFTVALQSLLDGFVFFYYTMFIPLAALAALCRVCDGEEKTE